MAGEKYLVLGSCFATAIGEYLVQEGIETMVNPFGTLFNPVSIRQSIGRLSTGDPFTEDECVMMGAGAGLWCSFSHYTRFARPTKEEFLLNANSSLRQASEFFKECDNILITFGTAFCFKHIASGKTVSNCLKIPAREFERYRLTIKEIVDLYDPQKEENACLRGKKITFTVSPIRHLADTLHGNNLSKSILLLAEDEIVRKGAPSYSYFPSYEIMLDELRDYSHYAPDTVHPGEEAVKIICSRFIQNLQSITCTLPSKG